MKPLGRYFALTTCAAALLSAAPAASGEPQFNGGSAYDFLKAQCEFGTRNPGSQRHRECLEWLAGSLEGMGCEVFRQSFSAKDPVGGGELRLTNIIARIAPGAGRPLLLCAHWDTRPRADRDPDPANRSTPILGANDGASGVAVLLEIARLTIADPPPRTLIVVFFDGEDLGRASHPEEFALGSKYWSGHQVPEPVDEAILLDMIGDADLSIPVEPYSELNAPELRGRLWDLARELELPAFTDRMGTPVQDDHIPLLQVGIPAVDLIDFDYPYWHTLEDTPDKCSAESLRQVGALLVRYIYGE